MKVKDWPVAGQMLAWFLDIATICKEWLNANDVDVEMMRWVKETKDGRQALADALSLLADKFKKYGKRIIAWTGTTTIPAQPAFPLEHVFPSGANGLFRWFDLRYEEFLNPHEEAVDVFEVVFGTLLCPTHNADITKRLGSNRVMTMLQIAWLVMQQSQGERPNGKRRILSTTHQNFFRVRGKGGKEVAVRVYWLQRADGVGWSVDFSTTGQKDGWEASVKWNSGARIFSGKSPELVLAEAA